LDCEWEWRDGNECKGRLTLGLSCVILELNAKKPKSAQAP